MGQWNWNDRASISDYNHQYYEKNKRQRWGYKGLYNQGGIASTISKGRSSGVSRLSGQDSVLTKSSAKRSAPQSSVPRTRNTVKPQTSTAKRDASAVSSLIAKVGNMTSQQLKAHKQELLDAYEIVKKNQGATKAETTSKTTTSSTSNKSDAVTSQKERAQAMIDNGKLTGSNEEEKTTKSTGSSKSSGGSKSGSGSNKSTGSSKSSSGSKSGSGSNKSTGSSKSSSGTKKTDKSSAQAEKQQSRADRTNARNAKAKTMDGISFDGLNSKGKSAAKKRKKALEEKRAKELARINEEYKAQLDAITAAGGENMKQQIDVLSARLKSDKAGIDKKYAKQLASIVTKFLKNPRYTGKDSGINSSTSAKNSESKSSGIKKVMKEESRVITNNTKKKSGKSKTKK